MQDSLDEDPFNLEPLRKISVGIDKATRSLHGSLKSVLSKFRTLKEGKAECVNSMKLSGCCPFRIEEIGFSARSKVIKVAHELNSSQAPSSNVVILLLFNKSFERCFSCLIPTTDSILLLDRSTILSNVLPDNPEIFSI